MRHALIDAQDLKSYVFGSLDYALSTMFTVIAACGDRRYDPVSDVLPFAHRVRAFVQVVTGSIDTQKALQAAAEELKSHSQVRRYLP